MNTLFILRILLAGAAATHLVIGLAAIFVPPGDATASVLAASYGASFDMTPVTHHIIRVLGAFMLFTGAMALLAFRDPWKYRVIIYALAFLFVVRVLQRFIFAGEIQENFHISTARLVGQSLFFLALAAIYLFLRPKEERAA